MYLDLLKKSILDLIYGPIVAGNARNVGKIATPEQISDGSFWPMLATSMIGQQRMDNIQECFEDVIKNNIEGDVIETGVWRGGASIFMAGINKFYNHLYLQRPQDQNCQARSLGRQNQETCPRNR